MINEFSEYSEESASGYKTMPNLNKYKYIIWDWNGTLLDDVMLCLDSVNELLASEGVRQISGINEYRDIFCFPVIDYYRKAGFDFNKTPFDILAYKFIDIYTRKFNEGQKKKEVGLYQGAADVIKSIKDSGIKQLIVSASEKKDLTDQVKLFGIDGYFEEMLGVEDHFAKGKEGLARGWMEKKGIEPEDIIFVGDTVHDYEVAKNSGCECIMVANGHQSEQLLKRETGIVVKDIKDILKMVN